MRNDQHVGSARVDVRPRARPGTQRVDDGILDLQLDEMRVRQSRSTSRRRHGDRLTGRDQLVPRERRGAGVQLVTGRCCEFADRLEHAQRSPEIEARAQRDLALSCEAHSPLPCADSLSTQLFQLAPEHGLGAARTGCVPGAEQARPP